LPDGKDYECDIPSTNYKNMYLDECYGLPQYEVDSLQETMQEQHWEYVEMIAKRRVSTLEQFLPMSDGQIFLGTEAVENGLIDEIGGINEARTWLEKETGQDLEIAYHREISNAR